MIAIVQPATVVGWHRKGVERLIGSIRRECTDHVIVLNERHLHRILGRYVDYYNRSRTHMSIGKDAPAARAVEAPEMGKVRSIPKVGGLHHRYTRKAA
ncbi:MAG: transposase [bacterium]|nr:transposase [bacterium]